MRIALDLDDTLCDMSARLDDWVIERGGLEMGYPTMDTRESFNLYLGASEELQGVINDVLSADGFFDGITPLPGAVEAVDWMIEEGHSVVIVTSPWAGSRTCAGDKFAWGREFIPRAEMVVCHNKGLVMADVLVDDRPGVLGVDIAVWDHVYYTRSYNKNLPGRRIDTWLGDTWKDVLGVG